MEGDVLMKVEDGLTYLYPISLEALFVPHRSRLGRVGKGLGTTV